MSDFAHPSEIRADAAERAGWDPSIEKREKEEDKRQLESMLYDEDDHDLFLTPLVSSYSATRGGASRHMLVNGRSERVAVKIKCSNNALFRVSPVFCTLAPGASQRLQIVRDPGQPGTDKLVVLYRASPKANPRDAFRDTEEGQDDIQRKVIALVAREDPIDDITPPPNRPPPPPPNGRGRDASKGRQDPRRTQSAGKNPRPPPPKSGPPKHENGKEHHRRDKDRPPKGKPPPPPPDELPANGKEKKKSNKPPSRKPPEPPSSKPPDD